MKRERFSIYLFMIFILGVLPLMAMEAPDLDQASELQINNQETQKKKRKRKPQKKINLNSMLGDKCDDPQELNHLACALLYQDELFNTLDFQKYEAAKEEFERAEKIIRNYGVGENDACVSVNSVDGLAIVLQHKKLLPCLLPGIEKPTQAQIEEVKKLRSEWREYPGVFSLVESWLENENEDVQQIAHVLQHQFKHEKLSKSIDKLFIKSMRLLQKFLSGKYRYVYPFIDCGKEELKSEFEFLLNLDSWYNEELASIVENKSMQDNERLSAYYELVSSLKKIYLGYHGKRAHYIKLYKEVYTKLEVSISHQMSLRNLLFQKVVMGRDVIPSKGQQGVIPFFRFSNNGMLPTKLEDQVPNMRQIKDKKIVPDQDGDWIPKHIKQQEKRSNEQKLIEQQRQKNKQQQKRLQQQYIIKKIEESLTAGDESSWLSETDDYIEFNDPKNNLITRILKTVQSEKSVSWPDDQIAAIEQTEWVKKWYDNPKAALEEQGYTTAQNKKYTHPDNYWKVIAYHSPALILKSYLKQLAQQGEIQNRRNMNQQDTVFTLPGIQFYSDFEVGPGKKWESGIFAWIVDGSDNKTNYHVEFRPTEVSKIAYDWLQKGYLEMNFPTIGEIAEYNKNG